MDEDQSLIASLSVYFLAIALVFIGWIVLGPGDSFLSSLFAVAHGHATNFAQWYQTKLEGSAKLIAPVITIVSGSYAILKAYKYAEARLHLRLIDFIGREEKRLKHARQQIRLKIERPGPQRPFKSPIFLADHLKSAVNEMGWGSYFLPPSLNYADYQVGSAIAQLDKQFSLSLGLQKHLASQLATAHLLKGSILAAEANRLEQLGQASRAQLVSALKHFIVALAADKNDVEALEYASHVHVRLGQDEEAEKYLTRLIELTAGEPLSLSRARALRYQSYIAWRRGTPLVAINNMQQAIAALPPQFGIDRVEEAELYDSLAEMQEAQGHVNLAPANRANATSIRDEVAKLTNGLSSEKYWKLTFMPLFASKTASTA